MFLQINFCQSFICDKVTNQTVVMKPLLPTECLLYIQLSTFPLHVAHTDHDWDWRLVEPFRALTLGHDDTSQLRYIGKCRSRIIDFG